MSEADEETETIEGAMAVYMAIATQVICHDAIGVYSILDMYEMYLYESMGCCGT